MRLQFLPTVGDSTTIQAQFQQQPPNVLQQQLPQTFRQQQMQQERVQSSLRRPSSQQVLPSLPSRSFLPREQLKFRPQQQQFFPTATSRLVPPFPAPTPSRILDNRQHRNPPGQAPPSHSILAALNQASGADFFRVAQRFGLRHFAARNRHVKQL